MHVVILLLLSAWRLLLGQEDTLSDSLNMRLVGVWEAPCTIVEFSVVDSFAFISVGDTLYVLSLAVSDSPSVIQKVLGYTWGGMIRVDPPFLCINGGTGGGDTLKILNISDPRNPNVVGFYALDPYPSWVICGINSDMGIIVLEHWSAYNLFVVLDIRDPSSPAVLDTLDFSTYFSPTTEIGPVSLSGHYLHLGGARSEWDSGIGYWIDYGEYYCFNISEPTEPTLVRYIDFGMFTDVWALAAVGRKAFISVLGATIDEDFISVTYSDTFIHVSGIVMDAKGDFWAYRQAGTPTFRAVLADMSCRQVGYYQSSVTRLPVGCITFIRDSLYLVMLGEHGDSSALYIFKHDTIGVGVQDGGHGSLSPHYRIYPNPAAPGMTVNLEGIDFAEVYDLTGRLLCKTQNSVNTEKLQPGLYILRCNIKDKKIYKKLVVIN